MPITRAILAKTPMTATIGQTSLSPIQPAIENAITSTTQVAHTLKKNSDAFIES